MSRMVLKPGDWVQWQGGAIREIVDVRRSGYGWRYPEIEGQPPAQGENYFISENSNDPFFEHGWKKIEPR